MERNIRTVETAAKELETFFCDFDLQDFTCEILVDISSGITYESPKQTSSSIKILRLAYDHVESLNWEAEHWTQQIMLDTMNKWFNPEENVMGELFIKVTKITIDFYLHDARAYSVYTTIIPIKEETYWSVCDFISEPHCVTKFVFSRKINSVNDLEICRQEYLN